MSALGAIVLHPTARRVAQIAAGLIFLAAALPKIADLSAFAGSVHNFHLEAVVPMAATNLLAMTIPWVELVAGLALVSGVRPRAGAIVYTALLAVFTLGVAQAMARGLSFDCGCFGKSGAATIGAKKLVENLAMLALGVVAAVERREERGRLLLDLGERAGEPGLRARGRVPMDHAVLRRPIDEGDRLFHQARRQGGVAGLKRQGHLLQLGAEPAGVRAVANAPLLVLPVLLERGRMRRHERQSSKKAAGF
jgi:putative oxidoreductase